MPRPNPVPARSTAGVHASHCCLAHGCKYGAGQLCPVAAGAEAQLYLCEQCDEDGTDTPLLTENQRLRVALTEISGARARDHRGRDLEHVARLKAIAAAALERGDQANSSRGWPAS